LAILILKATGDQDFKHDIKHPEQKWISSLLNAQLKKPINKFPVFDMTDYWRYWY